MIHLHTIYMQVIYGVSVRLPSGSCISIQHIYVSLASDLLYKTLLASDLWGKRSLTKWIMHKYSTHIRLTYQVIYYIRRYLQVIYGVSVRLPSGSCIRIQHIYVPFTKQRI